MYILCLFRMLFVVFFFKQKTAYEMRISDWSSDVCSSDLSMKMEDEVKRWTAKRKSALVLDIIQGKTTVAEASRSYDLAPSEIENWLDDAKRGMENALRAKPEDIREIGRANV